MTDAHLYPADLALALHERWPAPAPPLPPAPVLTAFISVLYQASLLSEEGQLVRAHAVLASPAELAAQPVALTDFHVMPLAEARAWSEQEVRRLSPAVQPATSLLAVEPTAEGRLRLWGLVFSGHQWDQPTDALPGPVAAPQALLVQVSGPGSLVFYYGSQRVLTLQRGRIEGHGFLQFPRAWGLGRFLENQQLAGLAPGVPWTPAQNECLLQLVLHMQRRALTQARGSGHGMLVVLVPTPRVAELLVPGGVLRPKYRLLPPAAGPRYPNLIRAIMQRLLTQGDISWVHYQQSPDAELRRLTAELDQFGSDLAAMGAVDGAIVLTHQMEVVGFGVEVQATQMPLTQVYRALDVAGDTLQALPADQSGTRHRAAYRLCLAAPDCLAIVVSQDGNVQFVHNQAGRVIVWDQLSF